MQRGFERMQIGGGGGEGRGRGRGRGGQSMDRGRRGSYQSERGGRGGSQQERGRGGRGGFRGGPRGQSCPPFEENPQILVNAYPIDVRRNLPFYKYDVKVEIHNEERKFRKNLSNDRFDSSKLKCVEILNYVFRNRRIPPPVYNRAGCMYSLSPNMEVNVTFNATDVPRADLGDCQVTVTITAAPSFQSSTNDFLSCVSGPDYQPNLLECVNILIERLAYTNPQLWYTKDAIHYPLAESGIDIGGGMVLKLGLKTSAKVYGNDMKNLRMALLVDIRSKVFHQSQLLLEKYNQLRNTLGDRGAVEVLKHLSVSTTYGNRRQIFSIQRVAETATSKKIIVKHEDTEVEMSVVQFFSEKKNIGLRHPELPLVWQRKGDNWSYFPMELLEVVPNQSVFNDKLSSQQQDDVTKKSAMPPKERLDLCRQMVRQLGLHANNQELADYGFRIGTNFIEIIGKTLHEVQVQHSNPMNNVRFDFYKVISMPKLTKWAVVNHGQSPRNFHTFVEFLLNRMNLKGIIYDRPMIVNAGDQTSKGILEKAKSHGLGFVFIVMSDRLLEHDELKYFELKHQIVTQIVKSSKADEVGNQRQNKTMDNILMKLAIKNYGIPFQVDSGSEALKIGSKTVLYLGIEFSHQQPKSGMDLPISRSQKLPSRVGYAGTYGDDPRKILGGYKYINSHDSVAALAVVPGILHRCAESFQKNNAKGLRTVMLFISGIAEGQWKIFEHSLKEIIKEKLPPGVKLMLLGVSRRSMERFFKQTGPQRVENVDPGTFTNADVVSPSEMEFFLKPHHVFQGTARIPKYTILLNEPSMPKRDIWQATHALCFMHGICTSAVAVPAVLTVADRCAQRGQTILRYYCNEKNLADISVEEANELLTNPEDGRLTRVRGNA